MEELPQEAGKRFKDLARYSQNAREQRYWEIYWSNRNLLPAAIRELFGKRTFKQFKVAEKKFGSYFNPDSVERVDAGNYLNGPEDWIISEYVKRVRPDIDRGAFAYAGREEDKFREDKEKLAGLAIKYGYTKYFGRRFEGEEHTQLIEHILENSMYGIDLHLVDLVRLARSLRYLIEMRSVKKSKAERDIVERALDEIAWHIYLDRKYNEGRTKDVLEIGTTSRKLGIVPAELKEVSRSWKKLATYQKFVALGPRAAMDGLGILDHAAVEKLRADRKFYKKAELAKAVAHIQLGAILDLLGKGVRKKKEDKEDSKITSGKTVQSDPYHAVARIFQEELNKIAKEKGKERVSREDILEAMKRASPRIRAEQILKSAKTPNLAETVILSEVARFYEEYTKRFGRPPVILDEEDAKEVLWNMEKYLEELVRKGPKHYFKGYVLAQLKRLKV